MNSLFENTDGTQKSKREVAEELVKDILLSTDETNEGDYELVERELQRAFDNGLDFDNQEEVGELRNTVLGLLAAREGIKGGLPESLDFKQDRPDTPLERMQ